MRSGLSMRVARLEAQRGAADETVRHFVVYLGDPEPEGLTEWDTVVYLPKKALTPEIWEEEMREKFGFLMDGPPDSSFNDI